MLRIDTADSYGPEVSELLIAEALYPYPKDLVIATKGGYLRPGPYQWVPDGRPQHLGEAAVQWNLHESKRPPDAVQKSYRTLVLPAC